MRTLARNILLLAGLTSLCATLLEVVLATVGPGEMRLRDAGWVQLAIKFGRGFGVDVFTFAPPFINRRFELLEFADLAHYVWVVSAVSLVLVSLLVAVLLLVHRLFVAVATHLGWRGLRIGWTDALAPAVVAAFAWPGVSASFWIASGGYASAIHFALGAAVCGGAAIALVVLTRLRPLPEIWTARLGVANAVALVLIGIVGLAGATLSDRARWSVAAPALPGSPNVLLISIDTLRADHLGSYGYSRDTSPVLDRLASEGVRFANTVAPTPWTLPSHMTMMTGLPPARHRVQRWGRKLGDDVVTLAEVARASGYATAGFVAAPYLDAMYGFAKGFDVYDDHSARPAPPSHQGITSPALLRVVTDHLESWDSAGRPAPFFVFLHFWDVHEDYEPPPPFDSMFGKVDVSLNDASVDEVGPERLSEGLAKLYDGEIRYVDMHIGKVLEKLEALGVADDTIIVVTSDHGEEFYEHGQESHRRQLYEESIRVPLIVRWKAGVPGGRVVELQARLQDVAPTIAGLMAHPDAPEFGHRSDPGTSVGVDMSALLLAEESEPELAARLPAITFGSLDHVGRKMVYARTNEFKLIRLLAPSEQDLFFDLRRDPAEGRNLATQAPLEVSRFKGALADWQSLHSGTGDYSRAVEVTEEHKQNLRALGYIE